jgi:hypothetical protein
MDASSLSLLLALRLPQGQRIWSSLPLRYLSWGALLAALEEQDTFSGLLDLRPPAGLRARLLFAEGRFLCGAQLQGQAVAAVSLDRALLPWASDLALVADLLPLPAPACAVLDGLLPVSEALRLQDASDLVERGFRGLLTWQQGGARHDQIWDQQPLTPLQLPPGSVVQLRPSPSRSAAVEPALGEWRAWLEASLPRLFGPGTEQVWRLSALQLAERYPVLDPFAAELVWEDGALVAEESLPPSEYGPALRALFPLMLRRAQIDPASAAARLADLVPVHSQVWRALGLAPAGAGG